MKSGDKVPVNIGPHTVAEATVKEVNSKDGTATLIVPATLVVMGVRTELTDLPTTQPTTETVITGVDRPVESAVVGENNANSSEVSTSEVSSTTPNVEAVEVSTDVSVADGGSAVHVQGGAVSDVSASTPVVEPPAPVQAEEA